MHQQTSWVDGTLAEAAELIAGRAAYRRAVPQTYAEKRAAGAADYLSSLGDYLKQNPALGHALVGSAAGAGLGGVGTALGNLRREPEERRSVLGSMLSGGLAGAGIGAGVGLARQGLEGIRANRPAPPSPEVFEHEGRRFQIDPKILEKYPDLRARVEALTAPPPLPAQAATGFFGGLKRLWWEVPITGTGAAVGLPLDFMAHNPLFGWARINPENATGPIGKEILTAGAEAAAKAKSLPEAITKAITEDQQLDPKRLKVRGLPGDSTARTTEALLQRGAQPARWLERLLDRLRPEAPQGAQPPTGWLGRARQLLGRLRPQKPPQGTIGNEPVMKVRETLYEPLKSVSTPNAPKNPGDPAQFVHETQQRAGTKTHRLSADARRTMMRRGHDALEKYQGRQLLRSGFGFGSGTRVGAPSLLNALGRRAAYLTIPAALEYAMWSGLAEYQKSRGMAELLRELRSQGLMQEVK